MLAFTDEKDVTKYEITRNYRSTSTIVEHARALIERNTPRIRKNLRAHNPMQQHIKIVETTPDAVKTALLRELKSPQGDRHFSTHQLRNRTDSKDTCQPPIPT